ncbi:MAG: APC family permease [Bacillota bacterium]
MALKRVLTLPTVVSTSVGLTFATSCFVAAVQVASYMAGDAAWIAILVAGSLCLMVGLCFSELNGILPSAAGIRLYFTRAYNDSFSLTISIFYMLIITSVIGAESYVLSQVLKTALPAIPSFFWIVLMIGLVVILNIRGIKFAGRFQDVMAFGLIASLLVLAVWAFARNGFVLHNPLEVSSPGGLVQAIALGVFLFIGFEWVTPLAEEVVDIKIISRGMLIAIGILSITYSLFTVAMSTTVPMEQLRNSPIPQVLFAQTLLGAGGLFWVLLISLSASVTTFNAGLLSVSRFFYATAREHAFPSIFSRLSNRYFTPWFSIISLGLLGLTVSAIIFITGSFLTLVNVGAAIESLVYMLAGLATYRLRKKVADTERPFKVPGGSVIPLATMIIFAFLTLAVLSQDIWALVYIVAGLLLCGAYVRWVVPGIKRKYQVTRRPSSRRAQARATGNISALGTTGEDTDYS